MRETVIIGGGPAGLAVAACLKEKGRSSVILERSDRVASAWQSHYDRLHLHTPKKYSSLPFLKMPKDYPKYPSRNQVIAYFDAYFEHFNPEVQFDTSVRKVFRISDRWILETNKGELEAGNVIIATGNNRKPNLVTKPGQKSFTGSIIHSSEYKNGRPFEGKRVLVVGFGNSACEIALCLHEHGAIPSMSVRSGVNIVPKEILGIPTFGLGVVSGILPPHWVDKLSAPIIEMLVGKVEDLGLKKLPYGPKEQIVKYQSNPLLDLGTVSLIREGKIKVFGDIQRMSESTIYFEENLHEDFDHIIYATGYKSALQDILEVSPSRLLEAHLPMSERPSFGKNGLYFCGFHVSAGGNIREMGIEAVRISNHIEEKKKLTPSKQAILSQN